MFMMFVRISLVLALGLGGSQLNASERDVRNQIALGALVAEEVGVEPTRRVFPPQRL